MRPCPEKLEDVRTGSYYEMRRAILMYEGAKEFRQDPSSLSEEVQKTQLALLK